jgi:SAM-dependent methyltransferase
MSKEEEEVKQLLDDAGKDAEHERLQEALEKFRRAKELARNRKSRKLLKQVQSRAEELFGKFRYMVEVQSIRLEPVNADGFILDIGGGGEGIIGKLNGKQVVAIDTDEEELEETKNEALKIVMDAADLKFLPKTFDACTAFFCLMYVPKNKHLQVFNQANRVLKDHGRFLLWDLKIPERQENHRTFAIRLKIALPNELVKAGYGTIWDKTQNLEYFKELARRTKFKTVKEWSRGNIFYLEMCK